MKCHHHTIDGKLSKGYTFKCRKLEAKSDKFMATVVIILMVLFFAGIIHFIVVLDKATDLESGI